MKIGRRNRLKIGRNRLIIERRGYKNAMLMSGRSKVCSKMPPRLTLGNTSKIRGKSTTRSSRNSMKKK